MGEGYGTKMILVFNNGEEWMEMTEEYPAYAMRITKESYDEMCDGGKPRHIPDKDVLSSVDVTPSLIRNFHHLFG